MSFFQIVNPGLAQWLGGFTAKNAAELKTGILAKVNNDGTLSPCAAGDKADGFAFTLRTLVYSPTAAEAAAGEAVTLVNGHVNVLVDAALFGGGSLPTFGADLYTDDAGLMKTSGAAGAFVGRVIGTGDSIRVAPNTSANVVLVECHLTA